MPDSHDPARWSPEVADVGRQFLSWLWVLAPIATFGVATAPLMVFAIVRVRHWLHILMSVVYVVCVVRMVTVLLMFANVSAPVVTLAGALAVNMLVATGHAVIIRRKLFGLDKPSSSQPSALQLQQMQEYALSIVHEKTRQTARELAQSDPGRAVELRIGRIDIPDRTFQDGGLIDVNNVPIDALIAQLPELLPYENAVATGQRFGFSSLDEMSATVGLPPKMLDHVAARLIFLQRYNHQTTGES